MSSMAKIFIPVLVLSLVALAENEDIGSLSLIPDNGSVTIGNLNGSISLVPGEATTLDIAWTITYPDGSDPGNTAVIYDNTEGFHIWTEQSDEDSPGANIDFIVSVPPESDYDYILEAINGNIEVEECGGFAMVSLVNGNISVREFNGLLWLEIVNGEITFEECPGIRVAEVVNGEVNGMLSYLDGDLSVSTVNGRVDLGLPSGAIFVRVETLDGSIDIEGFGDPVVITELVGKHAEFGEGEFSVTIETVSGDIEIRNLD